MSHPSFIDISGWRLGSWTVLKRLPSSVTPSGQPRTMWLCRCACGLEKAVGASTLMRGDSLSCRGCSRSAASLLQSRKLSDGRTIAGIARATGLKLTTVDRRWRRGWPLWALSQPHRTKFDGTLGVGRDVRGKRSPC